MHLQRMEYKSENIIYKKRVKNEADRQEKLNLDTQILDVLRPVNREWSYLVKAKMFASDFEASGK